MTKEGNGFWLCFFRNGMFLLFAVIILCIRVSSVNASQNNEWSGNINLLLGAKALDEDDWKPAEEQSEFGVEIDFKHQNWLFSIVIDFLGAAGEGDIYDWDLGNIQLESTTSEINIGVRKIWDRTQYIRPFVGGGLSLINAEAETSVLGVTISDDDQSTGIWLGGGIYWTLSEHFNIGFEAKYSTAEVEIYNVDVTAGGGHFGLLFGYHW